MSKGRSIFFRAGAGNFVILLLPIVVAMVLAFVVGLARFANPQSPYFFLGCGLMLVGWGLLILSKWPQIKRGDLWSFGVVGGDSKIRTIYRISYAVMVSGYLLATFSGSL